MTEGVGVFVGMGVFVGVGVGVGVCVGMGVFVGIGVSAGVGVGRTQANAGKATNRHTSNSVIRLISTPC
jgi:hypothetical protein